MTRRDTDALAVPAHARPAWERLHAQILATGPTPCAGPHRDDWTGDKRQQIRAADRCLDCPAMRACGTYAATAGETSGTWGGLTAAQRAEQRKAVSA